MPSSITSTERLAAILKNRFGEYGDYRVIIPSTATNQRREFSIITNVIGHLSQFRSESWCSAIEREMSLICIRIRNSFPFERLCTRTRLETQACSNSEMGLD